MFADDFGGLTGFDSALVACCVVSPVVELPGCAVWFVLHLDSQCCAAKRACTFLP